MSLPRTAQLREQRLRERRSSPLARDTDTSSTGNPGVTVPKKEQTFMDTWVEPTVKIATSYEDHGGVPYGVLEHMQPLGEAPSARVKARVKSEAPRKSILGRSSAATGLDIQESPEGTPAPQVMPQPQIGEHFPAPPLVDDEKDEDYAPVPGKKERVSKSRDTKRQSGSVPISGRVVKQQRKSFSSVNANRIYNDAKVKTVVAVAERRAMEVNRPDLAAAVHEIWQQSLTDSRLSELLEATLTQQATPEQTAEFQGYVRVARKKLKSAKVPKDASGKVPTATTNGSPAWPLRSPSMAEPVHESVATPAQATSEHTDVAKPKLSIKVKSPSKRQSSRPSGRTNQTSASPLKKKRSNSTGSDSSLTSLESTGEDGANAGEHEETDEVPSSKRAKTEAVNGKPHAASRGSLAAPDRSLKQTSAERDAADEDRDRELLSKRRRLEGTLLHDYHYQESEMRGTLKRPAPPQSQRLGNGDARAPPTHRVPPTESRTISTRGSRAVSEDAESSLSELSATSSRESTPQLRNVALKPILKRAKTKTSPEKRHLAAYSAVPGAGGAGKESPIGDDDNEELSENNDFCSACGGSGFLLCCDGCDRSFHFSCLDPPLNEDASELNEPWYCFVCVAKRPIASEQPEKPPRGLFAHLLNNLRKRNPSNFSLPQDIRDYFEGVSTDKNGLFTEAVNSKVRNRPGYDELPDYYRVKDGKGNTILCFCCGKSSQSHRPIIPCDYCGENWHLDCLDPPLANPPARSLEGKKLQDWMCPLHADHELRKVDTRLLDPRRLRRRVHVRKPRNAKVIESSLTRGFANNGVIDIVEDESEDSDSEFYDEETHDESVIYRMPASGIKLDFIDKVKNTRVQERRAERALQRSRPAQYAPPTPQLSALEQANFARRSFLEKQVALNLAQFATVNKDLDLGIDKVENLLGTLIAEAPSEVVTAMTQSEDAEKVRSSTSAVPPSPPSSDQTDQLSAEQRKELLMLQELIRRRLEGSKT